MDILVKVIQFFLCFTILVGIHEFGHFIMARIFKIRVEKFYIFFDPWFSLFKYNYKGTEYGVGWLPMGGYVKIAGMIDESMDKEQMKKPMQQDEFRAKPAWQRFMVMVAGVIMNVLLAISIYIGISYTWGDTYLSNEDAKWGYNFNEAGHELGFRDGDRILSIDGAKIDNINQIVNQLLITDTNRKVKLLRAEEEVTLNLTMEALIEMRREKGYENLLTLRQPFLIDSVVSPSAMALHRGDEVIGMDSLQGAEFLAYREYLKNRAGREVALTVKRSSGEMDHLTMTVSDQGTLGVICGIPYQLRTQHYSLAEAIPAGFHKTGRVLKEYWQQLKMIAQPKTKMYEELGGFIAIGNIFSGTWNWQDFWMKVAFLSIILAVMNIIPIPGLDGGHALFTLWEMITGRKVSDRILEIAQYIGLVIILMLLLYANGNDVYRFFLN